MNYNKETNPKIDIAEYSRRWKNDGDAKAGEALFGIIERMTGSILGKSNTGGLSKDDIDEVRQEVMLKCLLAARSYDPEKSNFITFINHSLTYYVHSAIRGVRYPALKVDYTNLHGAMKVLRESEKDPSVLERTKYTENQLNAGRDMEKFAIMSSLDVTVNSDANIDSKETFIDTVASGEPDSVETLHNSRTLNRINERLNAMPYRERRVFTARRLEASPVKLVVLGKEFGVSAEMIRLIENKVQSKLIDLKA